MTHPALGLVRHVEELAANAWPAPVVQVVDGWRLRFNWGVTGRANSVLPTGAGEFLQLEEKVELVEDFYRARDLPAAFQMSPGAQPERLDAYLEGRHYAQSSPVNVQTVSLTTRSVPLTVSAGCTVELRDSVDEEWVHTLAMAEGYDERASALRRGPLGLIGPPTSYAIARLHGKPAAVGRGVSERGWVGVFGMATIPAVRRQGAARAVLHALLHWGRAQGARAAYLQVEARNRAAIELYRTFGFATLYQYRYRRAVAG